MKGSYKALKEIKVGSSNSAFTLPEGSIIAVTQHDKQGRQILVEMGPGCMDWKHESFLNAFELLN